MRRAAALALIAAAALCFAFGVSLPLMTFEKLYFFTEDPSLLDLVASLYGAGDVALAIVVALVSLVFPLFKMAAVATEALWPERPRGLAARLVPMLGKWSLMDVLLVAIVIAAAKTSGLAEAFSRPGLWFYAGSTLAVSAAQWLLARRKTN
ncbi:MULTISPECIES: paraquat-inducible protein A [unclassified Rhizobium]|uniref:paraquat-inducible protein A n=1 Tax=unclassified Rhizobium TaxID=2613769 RepID=UPI0015FF4237|nr:MULTISPECIES: paraquat-inducible protein A [unclassified Rhizobium]MBB1250080.1 paraquat-inducible protein A [Rhizobium sp. G21]MCV3766038.1 paraquat-inducible protein A [Rhizobium sp. TRM95796]